MAMKAESSVNPDRQRIQNGEPTRIALIGQTGAGKSAVGNTLLGYTCFLSKPAGESLTKKTEWKLGKTHNSQRPIKVVDTPGILDTKRSKKEVRLEIEKALVALSPGPHAILFVVSPTRFTKEEQEVMQELKKLLKSDDFLNFVIIVMVRKNEIIAGYGEDFNMEEYVGENTCKAFQELYEKCKKRLVIVDNIDSWTNRYECAEELVSAIDNLGGNHLDHALFEMVNIGGIRRLITACF